MCAQNVCEALRGQRHEERGAPAPRTHTGHCPQMTHASHYLLSSPQPMRMDRARAVLCALPVEGLMPQEVDSPKRHGRLVRAGTGNWVVQACLTERHVLAS